jgi:REJ domain
VILVTNVTSTSISVEVTISQFFRGGYLYCTTLLNDAVPSSIGAVKSVSADISLLKGFSVAIPQSPNATQIVNRRIMDVASVQKYSVYCYLETLAGVGSTLQAVIRTKAVATTTCCKAVVFLKTPTYIYPNNYKYKAAEAAAFLFRYALPSSPSRSLMVTPVILYRGLPSLINATPPFLTFNASSPFDGQFYLSAPAELTGVISVYLTYSGLDAPLYSTPVANSQFTSLASPLPAPKLESAQFTDSGQEVIITFDSSTDRAGRNGTWTCDTLFSFKSAPLSTCTWLSPSTVSVSFPSMANLQSSRKYLNTSSTITLTGSVRALCTGTANCDDNPSASGSKVLTKGPSRPTAPKVVVSAPEFVTYCDDFFIDASASYGSGGRPFTSIIWTVLSDTASNLPALQAELNKYNATHRADLPVLVKSASLVPATYTFLLRLTNFLGVSSTASVNVLVKQTSFPLVEILSSSFKTVSAAGVLDLQSVTVPSVCAPGGVSSPPLLYSWSVTKEGLTTDFESQSKDKTRFLLKPHSLQVDQSYDVTLTATDSTSSTSSTATITVYVAPGLVTAAISGGYRRSVPVSKLLSLDASSSSDSDVAIPNLSFQVITESNQCTTPCVCLVLLRYVHFTNYSFDY